MLLCSRIIPQKPIPLYSNKESFSIENYWSIVRSCNLRTGCCCCWFLPLPHNHHLSQSVAVKTIHSQYKLGLPFRLFVCSVIYLGNLFRWTPCRQLKKNFLAVPDGTPQKPSTQGFMLTFWYIPKSYHVLFSKKGQAWQSQKQFSAYFKSSFC